ncbi:DUF3108 domain-containing protein [Massilia sp. Mn16-1_5]|uniref:DUF3108 domain-containing protein n=1 Tax=Massilia sp. Mn16-1_5 TaxID=2079199 RepID=UPI00109EC676|nr:DUF3108 domain-containing protein [Massilia sp. Mn16-1_5]
MKIAVHLARHRRLVALGGLSLLLHLLAIALIDALVAPPPVEVGAPIALRLVRETAAPAQTAAAQAPMAEATQASAPAPSPAPPRAELPAMQPLLPGGGSDMSRSAPSSGATSGIAPVQMPGRYRVQLPPSSRVVYAVTRGAPGQPPAKGESAELVWERSGGSYRLRLDGVLGALASTGGEDDAGLAPDEAREAGPAGGAQITRFNRAEGRIEQGVNTSEALTQGSQDRASVLLQLAGIGMADPDQVQDTIDIVVAGSGGARIARWQVVGRENLETPLGALAAVHLLQLAPAGEARVEVWLAPQRGWLPVQLRVTQADGTVANQLVTAIEQAAGQ